MAATGILDVLVVGGGPAGSTLAWSLAKRGLKVCVLERAEFPREKVCGDFVEPGGLRILEAMGVASPWDTQPAPAITRSRTYFGPRIAFQGPIPYYPATDGLPPHGMIIPRHELDTRLLENAAAAGADVRHGCAVTSVARADDRMVAAVKTDQGDVQLGARLVVGADGAQSIVARSAGLGREDRRHTSISRRVYIEGLDVDPGEAVIWFDEDITPGYGWMFPTGGGRANVGVGILSEASHREGLSVRKAFDDSLARLRLRHPGCSGAKIASRPLGGIVNSYGGITRNHFDGGLLVGDAGSFVDPMTGEGITQGMESSLIAAPVIMEALEAGRFDAEFLSRFDRAFRAYFDPAMSFLTLAAMVLRNHHLRRFFLGATERGFREATDDPDFAAVSGASFGGLDLAPLSIVGQITAKILKYSLAETPRALGYLLHGRLGGPLATDARAWTTGWNASFSDDPRWHVNWMADILEAAAKVQPALSTPVNPRRAGPPLGRIARSQALLQGIP